MAESLASLVEADDQDALRKALQHGGLELQDLYKLVAVAKQLHAYASEGVLYAHIITEKRRMMGIPSWETLAKPRLKDDRVTRSWRGNSYKRGSGRYYRGRRSPFQKR